MLRYSKEFLMIAGLASFPWTGAAFDNDDRGRYSSRDGYYRDDDRYDDDRVYRRNRGNGRWGQGRIYRDDRYGYGTSGPYGYGYGGSNAGAVASRIRSDLSFIASRSRTDGHERDHFYKAQQELSRFQDRWSRGQFDNGALNRAADNIQHLVNSDQIHPRDRDMLTRDLSMLRSMRSGIGQYGPYR